MANLCEDNREEIIDSVKQHLLESTNIQKDSDEWEHLDRILFRLWQLGYLKKKWPKQQQATQLKPCPFCGGEADYYCEEHSWADQGYISCGKYYDVYVECEKCGAKMEGSDEQQVIDAWNKRS